MIFRKTLLLIVLVFCAVYGWFNFDSIYVATENMFGLASNNTLADDNVELTGNPYLYPIVDEKIVLQPVAAVKKPATVVNAPIASSFMLSIPSYQIKAPIVFEPTTVESRIYSALEKGVVHYAETAMPGNPGTAIILGHSSSYPWYQGKYGSVFAQLSKLKEGDIVNIEKEGVTYSYKVSKSLIFSPTATDDYALRELEATDGSSLVLMTCWPTGANSKRVAVRADLII